MKKIIQEFPLQTLFTPILDKCQIDLVTLSTYTQYIDCFQVCVCLCVRLFRPVIFYLNIVCNPLIFMPPCPLVFYTLTLNDVEAKYFSERARD